MNEVYDSTFLCTYKQLDDDDLYRAQFLQAFKCKKWDDSEITRKTDVIFNIVVNHFKPCFDRFRAGGTRFTHLMLFMGEQLTDENLFRILFTMDLFSETHRCICETITHDKPTTESMKALMTCISS
uniref:Uncharacterized protein n=1 Tax=viral metagenome TaxID=1070528 RepID=A0A6C0LJX5_9ZZZZ